MRVSFLQRNTINRACGLWLLLCAVVLAGSGCATPRYLFPEGYSSTYREAYNASPETGQYKPRSAKMRKPH